MKTCAIEMSLGYVTSQCSAVEARLMQVESVVAVCGAHAPSADVSAKRGQQRVLLQRRPWPPPRPLPLQRIAGGRTPRIPARHRRKAASKAGGERVRRPPPAQHEPADTGNDQE